MSSPIYILPSGGDDSGAINATLAAGNPVVLVAGNYKISNTIVVPLRGSITGQGRATSIVKDANIDMIELGAQGYLRDFGLVGRGDVFTGRGIVVKADQHYQTICRVHIHTNGYCLDFEAPDAGSGITVEDCYITRWPNLQAYSIKLPNSDSVSGGNRTFRSIWASGGYGIDVSGAHNTLLDRCNMAAIRMNKEAKTLYVQNSRIVQSIEWRGNLIWAAFNNLANICYITPECFQSLFIMPVGHSGIGRQDPATNGNVIW